MGRLTPKHAHFMSPEAALQHHHKQPDTGYDVPQHLTMSAFIMLLAGSGLACLRPAAHSQQSLSPEVHPLNPLMCLCQL